MLKIWLPMQLTVRKSSCIRFTSLPTIQKLPSTSNSYCSLVSITSVHFCFEKGKNNVYHAKFYKIRFFAIPKSLTSTVVIQVFAHVCTHVWMHDKNDDQHDFSTFSVPTITTWFLEHMCSINVQHEVIDARNINQVQHIRW